MSFDQEYTSRHQGRFGRTLSFMQKHLEPPARIIDLGPPNPFSKVLSETGYEVKNTKEGLDLDLHPEAVEGEYEVVTAFEIIEHLVSPFPILKEVRARKLFASVPLRLWFATAYWNEQDPFDRHYHEFEERQFHMLLEKAGWEVKASEKWISKAASLGIRPLLRNFVPRHLIVYCERNN